MKRKRFSLHTASDLLILLAILTVACAGCSSADNPKVPDPDPKETVAVSNAERGVDSPDRASTPPASKDRAEPLETGAATLREADAKALQEVLDASQGEVVLVDFWATWCVPCKKNFPKVVGYENKYAADGLVVVSVSIDDAESHAEALAFLQSVKASGTNLRSQWGAGTESAEQFDFSGEVPFYKLFDRSGKLRYQFSGSADITEGVDPLEQIEPRILELLAEST